MKTPLILIGVWALAAIASLPVILHWAAPPPRISRTSLAVELGYVAAAFICYWIYRSESRRLARSQALALTFMVFLLTSVVNNLHKFDVDQISGLFPYASNEVWQEQLQNNVVNLSPGVAPHSYRFLPNGMVRWMEMGHVRFRVAADVYRLLCGLLLFYAIYRYARLYTSFFGGILAMLLVSILYPVSFEGYAGQLTDPLSHLSFVLGFLFLETENFPFLFTTLLVGSLAKETVLALSGYYVLFCRQQRHYRIKAATLCASALAVYFAVRFFVLHGTMQYQQVSGVSADHILMSWKEPQWPGVPRWPGVFLLTACAYLPFFALCWKRTPLSLKGLYFYLLPVLFISSLVFSWLNETRNFMPMVFVSAVVAARCSRTQTTENDRPRHLRDSLLTSANSQKSASASGDFAGSLFSSVEICLRLFHRA